jgi:exopolysaccharide biosynthesis polyprenyl glycosylphosphotransferase
VSSDLSTNGWAAVVEQTLTRLPEESRKQPPASHARPSVNIPHVEPERVSPSVSEGRKVRSGLRARLLVGDVVAVAGTWLVLGTLFTPATTGVRRWGAAIVAAALILATMQLLGLYRSRLCAQRGQEACRIVLAGLTGAVAFELLRGGDRSNGATLTAAGACVLALLAFRWMYRQWLRAERARGRHLRSIVMIGTNEDAVAVWTMLHSQPELGYRVRGIIGRSQGRPDWIDLPCSPDFEQLARVAKEAEANGVLVVANALSADELRAVIELSTANGLHVQVWPGFRGLDARRVRHYPMSGETFVYVEPRRRPTWQFVAKRALDLLGATLGLLLAAPILLVAWIAIRLEGGGPALYRQERIGLNGKPFIVYKLRTMAPECEVGVDLALINERTDGPLFKASGDPRVTRVGAVVRALSIDELPQFFNVLTGTMSLVGPRPALPHEVSQFDAELQRRHAVKPGITGLWQIEARDNPSFHTYRRLDLLYVDNWSIGLDIFILLATVPMVVAHAVSLCRRDGNRRGATSEAA